MSNHKIQSYADPKTSKLLCLDMSLRNTGWVIVDCGEITEFGCIENPSPEARKKGKRGRNQGKVVEEIWNYSEVLNEIRRLACMVDCVNVEVLYTSQSKAGAVAIGFCWATVAFIRTLRPTNVILPKQVKQIVKAKGKVSKQEVANHIRKIHPKLAFQQVPDHVTDAAGVYEAYKFEYDNRTGLFT